MTQEPQKNNTILIVSAIIGIVGTVVAATIGAIGNYKTEKLRQEAELTRIALVSIPTSSVFTPTLISPPIQTQTVNSLCPFQSETDWGTIKNIFNAEGQAVVEEDMATIRQIYAPNANIREAHSGIGGNQVINQFQELFAERDFQQWEHYELKLVDNTGQVAWVTGGLIGRSVYVNSGQVEDIQTDPQYDHWTFEKNENGCWVITAIIFNAADQPFP